MAEADGFLYTWASAPPGLGPRNVKELAVFIKKHFSTHDLTIYHAVAGEEPVPVAATDQSTATPTPKSSLTLAQANKWLAPYTRKTRNTANKKT